MAKLKVYVKNNQTEVKVPVGIRLLIRRCCQAVLSTEGYKENAEVSVSFVSNTEIKKLNGIYRNKDSVTDVLSFPLSVNGETEISKETGYNMLGDIVISLETAVKQAQNYGHSKLRELAFLVAHSMLHLCGYDHMEPEEAAVMEQKQEAALNQLGITRDK